MTEGKEKLLVVCMMKDIFFPGSGSMQAISLFVLSSELSGLAEG